MIRNILIGLVILAIQASVAILWNGIENKKVSALAVSEYKREQASERHSKELLRVKRNAQLDKQHAQSIFELEQSLEKTPEIDCGYGHGAAIIELLEQNKASH